MRWIWIDRILELERGVRCVAVKNISAAEDVLHDHFPATPERAPLPCLPHPLVIEGMAQTAGILTGHARDFAEKVILAKIGKATFTPAAVARPAGPGDVLRYTATLDRIDDTGASTTGIIDRLDPATGESESYAQIDLMFSHVDRNRAGVMFPEHNFVFTDQFMDLLTRSGIQ